MKEDVIKKTRKLLALSLDSVPERMAIDNVYSQLYTRLESWFGKSLPETAAVEIAIRNALGLAMNDVRDKPNLVASLASSGLPTSDVLSYFAPRDLRRLERYR